MRPFPLSRIPSPLFPLPLVCCRGKKRARTGHHRKSVQHDHHHARTARPVAPPEPVAVTGDHDMDAVLWLRQVVQSGDAGLIAACPTPEGICWTLTNLDTMESAVFRPAALHHT